MSWSLREKKKTFFVLFILPEENFLNICVLSQGIVYGIHFQNIRTFTYKHYSTEFYCFLLNPSKAFSLSLNCSQAQLHQLLTPERSNSLYMFKYLSSLSVM